ncbi:MAG: hypothetical protein R2689_00035 [Microthrixaceae bacterium]
MVRFIPRAAASVLAVLATLAASVPAAGALGEPFTVTAPAAGETVAGGTYTFAGTGEPGAAVEWLNLPAGYTQCATIDEDGTWTCDIDIPDVPQRSTPTFLGTIHFMAAGVSGLSVPLTATPVAAPSLTGVPGESLTDGPGWLVYRVPLEGVSFAPSGSGEPGATITVAVEAFDEFGVGTYGPPICSVTVSEDGTWACPDELVTVPPLAESSLRFTGVQIMQSIPGYTDAGGSITTVQAAFEVTDPSWYVTIPDGGATATAFSGTGVPGAEVRIGGDNCATIAPDGTWNCVVDGGRMPPGFYDMVVTATVPHPVLGLPLVIGEVTRTVIFEGPSGTPPDVPDAPHPVLTVPCVGATALRMVGGEVTDGENLSDGCSCPAGARFGDGLSPDPLVGACSRSASSSTPTELSVLVSFSGYTPTLRGWRGEMERSSRGPGQVLYPEPGEMPVGADTAWAEGLDISTYTPDWWKVAHGDTTGCLTDPVPPPADAAPVAPPELARTGVSTTGFLLGLAALLATSGAALVATGRRLSTRAGR